jgi:hypothetical protein
MTIEITHAKESLKADGGDASLVRASDWNAAHVVPVGIETMLEAVELVWQSLILTYKGTVASIPAGWHLCDGTGGTIDLRDKFVVGVKQDDAGVAKTNITGALLQSGGTNTHNHSDHAGHTHAGGATATLDGAGNHQHGYPHDHTIDIPSTATASAERLVTGGSISVARQTHTHQVKGWSDVTTLNTDPAGSHNHTIPAHTHSANAAQTHSAAANIPTFYALCFIAWVG